MSLAGKVMEQLQPGGAGSIEETADGVRVRVDLQESDRLGAAVNRIEVERTAPAPGPADQVLRRQAQGVIDRVTYIDGELRVVEVDGVSRAVQIRTKKPQVDEEGPRYAEVELRDGNRATLRRKHGSDPVPFHVSRENLGRVIDDLSDILTK